MCVSAIICWEQSNSSKSTSIPSHSSQGRALQARAGPGRYQHTRHGSCHSSHCVDGGAHTLVRLHSEVPMAAGVCCVWFVCVCFLLMASSVLLLPVRCIPLKWEGRCIPSPFKGMHLTDCTHSQPPILMQVCFFLSSLALRMQTNSITPLDAVAGRPPQLRV